VDRLFAPPHFVNFGPCALHPETALPQLHGVAGHRPTVLRRRLREKCPRVPGVYGMLDLHGELLYVGKAKNLRSRLLTYFRPRSRDPKAGRIVGQAQGIVWETCADEFAALHRELELIRRWRPRFNVQGQPHSWQHTYVCLGRSPAPYAFLARRPPAKALASFGPVLAGRRAREAMRRLNDWFQLRDCPHAQDMVFADQAQLFPVDRTAGCLRLELATCLGPCAAACSQADYAAKVRAARAFLTGSDPALLVNLERAMKEAAHEQAFERAAVLRDKLAPLAWLHRQLEQMRQADAMGALIYPVKGHDGAMRWYLLHAGRAVAAAFAPSATDAIPARLAVARQATHSMTPADQVAGVLLLAAWLRRHPQERARLRPLDVLAAHAIQERS
jgi:excinuclease ABC subunit C